MVPVKSRTRSLGLKVGKLVLIAVDWIGSAALGQWKCGEESLRSYQVKKNKIIAIDNF